MKSKKYLYNKRWRKNHLENYRKLKRTDNRKYNHKYPKRRAFAQKVYGLLQRGRIKKKPCVECGSSFNVQACSLSKPFDPLWLCDPCNKALHRRIKGYA